MSVTGQSWNIFSFHILIFSSNVIQSHLATISVRCQLSDVRCQRQMSLAYVTVRNHCQMSLLDVTVRYHCQVSLLDVTVACHSQISLSGSDVGVVFVLGVALGFELQC